MSRITPAIGTSGSFEFRLPWVVNPGESYTLSGIKTLDELVRSGVDPKTSIYQPMGLTDGSNGFDWASEFNSNPLILSLIGTLGNAIIIPDTYISAYPSQSSVEYARFTAAIDLGLYPKDTDFTTLATDLADLATTYSTQAATATIYLLPIDVQPTEAEHNVYENAQKYFRIDSISNSEQIALLLSENQSLRVSQAALIARLRSVDPTF